MGRQAVSALVFLAGLAARLGYRATYATKHYAPFLRYWGADRSGDPIARADFAGGCGARAAGHVRDEPCRGVKRIAWSWVAAGRDLSRETERGS